MSTKQDTSDETTKSRSDEETCQWCGRDMRLPCESWCYGMQRQADMEEGIYY